MMNFCSGLFDYKLWNHIPQVIEGGMACATITFISERISFTHGPWNHF